MDKQYCYLKLKYERKNSHKDNIGFFRLRKNNTCFSSKWMFNKLGRKYYGVEPPPPFFSYYVSGCFWVSKNIISSILLFKSYISLKCVNNTLWYCSFRVSIKQQKRPMINYLSKKICLWTFELKPQNNWVCVILNHIIVLSCIYLLVTFPLISVIYFS